MKMQGGPFDGFEVISTYTDADAVSDGVLVPVGKNDNVMRNVFEMFRAATPTMNKPVSEESKDAFASRKSRDFISLYGLKARRVYEQNIDGGIFHFDYQGRKLWLMPNEIGGLTLMFPEDY